MQIRLNAFHNIAQTDRKRTFLHFCVFFFLHFSSIALKALVENIIIETISLSESDRWQ